MKIIKISAVLLIASTMMACGGEENGETNEEGTSVENNTEETPMKTEYTVNEFSNIVRFQKEELIITGYAQKIDDGYGNKWSLVSSLDEKNSHTNPCDFKIAKFISKFGKMAKDSIVVKENEYIAVTGEAQIHYSSNLDNTKFEIQIFATNVVAANASEDVEFKDANSIDYSKQISINHFKNLIIENNKKISSSPLTISGVISRFKFSGTKDDGTPEKVSIELRGETVDHSVSSWFFEIYENIPSEEELQAYVDSEENVSIKGEFVGYTFINSKIIK